MRNENDATFAQQRDQQLRDKADAELARTRPPRPRPVSIMPPPFQPDLMARLQDRFDQALIEVFDMEAVEAGTQGHPASDPVNVFDFQGAGATWRAVVSMQKKPGQPGLWLAFSITFQTNAHGHVMGPPSQIHKGDLARTMARLLAKDDPPQLRLAGTVMTDAGKTVNLFFRPPEDLDERRAQASSFTREGTYHTQTREQREKQLGEQINNALDKRD